MKRKMTSKISDSLQITADSSMTLITPRRGSELVREIEMLRCQIDPLRWLLYHTRIDLDPYVTHADLLRIAKRKPLRRHCHRAVLALCRPAEKFWVFKATVYKSAKCRGFVGFADAHPGNVSPLIFNHAESVNRALRNAYGIALCSVEELPPWTAMGAPNEGMAPVLESRSA